MAHIVLLGDSIFDNRAYVGAGEPDVARQLQARLPAGDRATLRAVDGAITAGVPNVGDAFGESYRSMVEAVLAARKPTTLCTIYDPRFPDPRLQRLATTALTLFNDIITRAAFSNGLPLLDLRLICNENADYANPIEPSAQGGEKIAAAIARLVAEHDFARRRTEVFVR